MTVNLQPETRQFNRDAQLLLQDNTPQARTLLSFIYYTLRNFGLEGYITETDVFVEAYLRGMNFTLTRGERIFQSRAWLRKTAYNIIREWQRERSRYCDVAFDELMEQGVLGYHEEDFAKEFKRDSVTVEAEVQKVVRAFQGLDSSDRTLIRWKFIETLSWQSIQARLADQGEPAASLPALRKRGQRALERLRRNYHQQQ